MALKKDKKEKKEKEKKDKGPKVRKAIVFDPSDGVTWHDFAAIFVMFFKFIYRIARLVFAPVFWIYAENVRMIRFVRAKGADRPMSKYEREFVESIPVIFALTGLIGGIILGILIIIRFQEVLQNFFNSLSLDFFKAIFDAIAAVIVWIYNAIVWIISGIVLILHSIWNAFAAAFALNPIVALLMLAAVGFVVIIIWLVFTETGAFKTLTDRFSSFFKWLVETPDKFRFSIQNYYRRFNHIITAKMIGEERMATRTLSFFKKSVLYTVILSAWNYIAGIYIATKGTEKAWTPYPEEVEKIIFASIVLLLAGLVSGFLFMVFLARFLDAINRKKYIAPEFIKKDGEFDDDKIKSETQKAIEDKPWLREYVPKSERTEITDEERPWRTPTKKDEEETEE